MLDGDHYRTAELVGELLSNAQMKHVFDVITCLNPEFKVTDGKYCYDYKGLIIGVGDTVHQAMIDFNRKYYNQKILPSTTTI